MFGGFLFLPQYLQLVVDLSPLEAGMWTLPWALAFVVGSNVTPHLVRRIRPAYLMGGGLAVASFGFALFTQLQPTSGFPMFLAGSVIFSLGTSPLFTLTNDLIIGSAPQERAGAAAGMSETAAELGGALGIAMFGSIGVAIYRGAMAGAIPSGVPLDAAEAARGTLGGALEVAAGLPGRVGPALAHTARDAFAQGVHVSAAIAALGAIGLAVLVLTLLRRVGTGPQAEERPGPTQEMASPGAPGPDPDALEAHGDVDEDQLARLLRSDP